MINWFTIDKESLQRRLQPAARVASRTTDMPIYDNVSLKVTDGVLDLAASNGSLYLQSSLPVENAVDGGITISAFELYDYVTKLPAETELHFRLDVQRSTVMLRRSLDGVLSPSEVTFKGLPYDDFPRAPFFSMGDKFFVSSGLLKRAIDGVVFAASDPDREGVPKASYCVHFQPVEAGLYLAAMSPEHVSRTFLPYNVEPERPDYPKNLFVQKSSAKLLSALLDKDNSTTVEIAPSSSKSHLLFSYGSLIIGISQYQAEPMDISRFISMAGSGPNQVELNVSDLTGALALMTGDKTKDARVINLTLLDNNNMVELYTMNNDGKVAVEYVEAWNIRGGWLEVSLRLDVLTDCLKVLESDHVRIILSGSNGPVLFQPIDDEGDTLDYQSTMLIPMQLVARQRQPQAA